MTRDGGSSCVSFNGSPLTGANAASCPNAVVLAELSMPSSSHASEIRIFADVVCIHDVRQKLPALRVHPTSTTTQSRANLRRVFVRACAVDHCDVLPVQGPLSAARPTGGSPAEAARFAAEAGEAGEFEREDCSLIQTSPQSLPSASSLRRRRWKGWPQWLQMAECVVGEGVVADVAGGRGCSAHSFDASG